MKQTKNKPLFLKKSKRTTRKVKKAGNLVLVIHQATLYDEINEGVPSEYRNGDIMNYYGHVNVYIDGYWEVVFKFRTLTNKYADVLRREGIVYNDIYPKLEPFLLDISKTQNKARMRNEFENAGLLKTDTDYH